MKRTQIFIVMFLLASFAMGQDTIRILVPPFAKYLKVTGEKVNLRKSPTTQSAKLQVWTSDGGSSETQYHPFYAGEKGLGFNRNLLGSYVSPAHFENGAITPIVEESGEWCKVIYTAYPESDYVYHRTKDAYIMSKFGQKIDVATNLTLADFGVKTVSRREGKYSAIAMTIAPHTYKQYNMEKDTEEEIVELRLQFSVLVDNTYLWTKIRSLTIENLVNNNQPRIYWTKEEYDDDWVSGINTICHIRVPKASNINAIAANAMQYILTMPDNEFIKLVTEDGRIDDNDDIYFSGKLSFKSTAGDIIDVLSSYYEEGKHKMIDRSLMF